MSDPAALLATATQKIATLEADAILLSGKASKVEGLTTEVTTLTQKSTALGKLVDDSIVALKACGIVVKENESLVDVVKRVGEENKTLLAAKAARDEMDIIADVDRAMDHYGPTGLKKVTEEQKSGLITLRRESPKSFQEFYKPLTRDEIRLLTSAAPPPPVRKPPTTIDPKDPVMLSHSALTGHLMSTEKLGYSDASDKAAKMIRERDAATASPAAGQ